MLASGTQRRRRGHPGTRRRDGRGRARLRQRARGVGAHPRRRLRDLRAGRRAPATRSSRLPTPASSSSSASPRASRFATWPRSWRTCRGAGRRLIGPNCPGLIPRRLQAGHHAGQPSSCRARPASCRARARSPTRSRTSSRRPGIGQSTAVGMGGDAVHGIGFIECLELFEADRETAGVALDRRDRRRRRGAGGDVHP